MAATQHAVSAIVGGERVVFYTAVTTDFTGSDWVYFIVTERSIHLVDSELAGDAKPDGLKVSVPLLSIERVTKLANDPDSMMLELSEGVRVSRSACFGRCTSSPDLEQSRACHGHSPRQSSS